MQSRLFAALIVSSALAPLVASQGSVSLSSFGSDTFAANFSGPGLIDDLNCDEIVYPRANLKAIAQNLVLATAEETAEAHHAARILGKEVVLAPGTPLNDDYLLGNVYGVEYDWWFPNGTVPPTGNRLTALDTEVYGEDANGNPVLVAMVYAYDAAQYDTRKTEIEDFVGSTMGTYRVWTENVVTGASPNRWLAITGDENEFFGYLSTKGSVRLYGMDNSLFHGIGSMQPLVKTAPNFVAFQEIVTSVAVQANLIHEATARSEAQANGSYYSGDVVITDQTLPNDGMVFAEGKITVACNGQTADWTLVSAGDKVVFSGDNNLITPFDQHVTAVSFTDRVVVSGDDNTLVGEMLAPAGWFDVSGSYNVIHGVFRGTGSRISGSYNVVSDGTHPGALEIEL